MKQLTFSSLLSLIFLISTGCINQSNAQTVPITDNIDTLAKLLNVKYYEREDVYKIDRIWFDTDGKRVKSETFNKAKGVIGTVVNYEYTDKGKIAIEESDYLNNGIMTYKIRREYNNQNLLTYFRQTNTLKNNVDNERILNYDENGQLILHVYINKGDTTKLEKWKYRQDDSLAMYSNQYIPNGRDNVDKREILTTNYIYYEDTKSLKQEVITKKSENGISKTIKDYSKQRKLLKEERISEYGTIYYTKRCDYFPDGTLKIFDEKSTHRYKKEVFNKCGRVFFAEKDRVEKEIKIVYDDDCKIISKSYIEEEHIANRRKLLFNEDYIYDDDKLVKHTLKVVYKDTGEEFGELYEYLEYDEQGRLTKQKIEGEVLFMSVLDFVHIQPTEHFWSPSESEFENKFIYDNKGRLIEKVEYDKKTTYEYTDTSTIKRTGLKTEVYNLDSTYYQVIQLEKFTDEIEIDLGNGNYKEKEVEGIDTLTVITKVFNNKKEIIYMEYLEKQHNTDDTRRKVNFEYYDNGTLKLVTAQDYYRLFRSYAQNTKTDLTITYGEQGEVIEHNYITKDLYNDTLIFDYNCLYTYDFTIQPIIHDSYKFDMYKPYSIDSLAFVNGFLSYGSFYQRIVSNSNENIPLIKVEESVYDKRKGNPNIKTQLNKQIEISYNTNGQMVFIDNSTKGKYNSEDKSLQIPDEFLSVDFFETIGYEYDKKDMLIKRKRKMKGYDYRTQKTKLVEEITTWTYEYYD